MALTLINILMRTITTTVGTNIPTRMTMNTNIHTTMTMSTINLTSTIRTRSNMSIVPTTMRRIGRSPRFLPSSAHRRFPMP